MATEIHHICKLDVGVLSMYHHWSDPFV